MRIINIIILVIITSILINTTCYSPKYSQTRIVYAQPCQQGQQGCRLLSPAHIIEEAVKKGTNYERTVNDPDVIEIWIWWEPARAHVENVSSIEVFLIDPEGFGIRSCTSC